MSIQLPILSIQQQQDLITGLQINALFPISFRVNRLMSNANFPTADAAGGGRYLQMTYTPTISIGIAGITTTVFQVAATAVFRQVAQVSLNNTMTMADAGSAVVPTDSGNILFTGSFLNNNFNGYTPYLPSNYYIQANTPIYLYYWIETAGIGSGNTYIGQIILHTIQTGSQV